VALALSRIMAILPFRIVVLDDRKHVPTMAQNHFASELKVIDYDDVAEHVEEGEHCWAAIMTHAHQADAEVLARLVTKDLRYLGMMGSKAKVTQILANLEATGTPRELLDRVYAPIGLSIGSHTPEEIAVSIAAEIIAARNQK
jgi:xanthine dehydrogenase accessory factor